MLTFCAPFTAVKHRSKFFVASTSSRLTISHPWRGGKTHPCHLVYALQSEPYEDHPENGPINHPENVPTNPPENAPVTSAAKDEPEDVDFEMPKDLMELPEMKDTTIFSIPLPLGLYLEQTTTGKLFVDEIDLEGNAAKVGLKAGDIVVAVSLPYGDSLYPVPEEEPLEKVVDFIETRTEDTFRMAIRHGEDLEKLREDILFEHDFDGEQFSKNQEQLKDIFIDEYPFVPEADDEEQVEGEAQLEALRGYGLDMDVDVSEVPPPPPENSTSNNGPDRPRPGDGTIEI